MSTAEPIPANAPVPVIFARDANTAALAPIARPAVAVIPQYSTWNDFTYYFTARLLVLLPQQQPVPFDMHFMVSGFDRTDDFFKQLLLHQPWVPIELANASYVGILDSIESYGSLIELLGFARAMTSLRLLGDAVVLRTEGTDTARLALFDTDRFHLGALRASSNYVAFRHGRRYLRPEPQAPVPDAATSFHMATNLLAADNPYDINFDFRSDELNRDRVAVLIGRNGNRQDPAFAKPHPFATISPSRRASSLDRFRNHPNVQPIDGLFICGVGLLPTIDPALGRRRLSVFFDDCQYGH
ncbi:hypothetical protein [Bradyrhizobium lupini]|uniref:hypothetical protein n=1 Tax=Rhizobium lupini TaxID=136996 RepID=UPI0034C61309